MVDFMDRDRVNYMRAAYFMRRLRKLSRVLGMSAQEFKTLKGQAIARDVDGAERGLQKMMRRCGG